MRTPTEKVLLIFHLVDFNMVFTGANSFALDGWEALANVDSLAGGSPVVLHPCGFEKCFFEALVHFCMKSWT